MQLDEDVLSAESLLQRAQPRLVVGRGQEEQVPGVLLHRLQRGAGLALELALVGQADETAEVRVAAAGAGKEDQLAAVNLEAGADHRADADTAACPQEADPRLNAAVVGYDERRDFEVRCLDGQLRGWEPPSRKEKLEWQWCSA